MRALAPFVVLLCLSAPAPAAANPLCRVLGLCLYLSPGFELTVVDAETDRPLADVYAWAEWVQYGAHGIGGPLMIQNAVSSSAGQLTFPRWGPTFGSRAGLLLGVDPAVILFKPGYATLLVQNEVPLGASEHAVVRGLSQQQNVSRLRPFRGSDAEWVEQLRKLVFPALSSYVSDAARDRFRDLYLKRLGIVAAELARLAPNVAEAATLKIGLDQSERFLRGDQQ
jgi:hypothetical protein